MADPLKIYKALADETRLRLLRLLGLLRLGRRYWLQYG